MSFETDPRWTALTSHLTLDRPAAHSGELVGRHDAIRKVFDIVSTPGEHIAMYGERGIGKTSLVNVLANELRAAQVGVFVAAVQPGDSFDALIRRAVGEAQGEPNDEMRFVPLPPNSEAPDSEATDGEAEGDPLAEMLPEGEAAPGDIVEFLDQTLAGHPVLILDDYDRLDSAMTDRAMSDLVKGLAESKAQATVVFVGQGDSADALISNHDRVFESLHDLPLRLLRPSETLFLIERLETASGMPLNDNAKKLILMASLGLPGAVQSLTRDAVAATLSVSGDTVEWTQALNGLARHAEATAAEVREPVDDMLGDDPDDEFAQTLFAIAAAHTDWYGRFFKSQVTVSLNRRYPALAQSEDEIVATLDSLCGDDPGSLFRKRGTEYRFANIWMKQYLLTRYLAHRYGVPVADSAHAATG